MPLTINDDHPFRICQLTDIHLGNFPFNEASQKTLDAIDQLLDTHPFDLIMITGDLIWGTQVTQPQQVLGALYHVLNRYAIPVAITYGNHDTEGNFTRHDLRRIEEQLRYPAEKCHSFIIDDRESYTLEIYRNQKLIHVLYVWDSGAYSHWPNDEKYAAIEPEQIDWFFRLPYERATTNEDLAFLHIPFPEYQQAAQTGLRAGIQNETVCSPMTNSGLVYSLLREKNVKGVFVGHDHDNNYVADYHGLTLTYGNITGYNAYGNLPRGARLIELEPHDFHTQLILF